MQATYKHHSKSPCPFLKSQPRPRNEHAFSPIPAKASPLGCTRKPKGPNSVSYGTTCVCFFVLIPLGKTRREMEPAEHLPKRGTNAIVVPSVLPVIPTHIRRNELLRILLDPRCCRTFSSFKDTVLSIAKCSEVVSEPWAYCMDPFGTVRASFVPLSWSFWSRLPRCHWRFEEHVPMFNHYRNGMG